MKKFALVAVLGALLAMAPAVTSGAGVVGNYSVPSTVHFVVGGWLSAADQDPVNICVDGEEVATITPTNEGAAAAEDVVMEPGNRLFTATYDNDCENGVDGYAEIVGGAEYTAVFQTGINPPGGQFTQGWVVVGQDDATLTPLGMGRIIVRHAAWQIPPVNVCIDGDVVSNPIFEGGPAFVAELAAPTSYAISLNLGGDCSDAELIDALPLAAGEVIVINIVNQYNPDLDTPTAFTLDVRTLFPGQETAANVADTPAFCAVVNPGLGQFTDGLKALLTEDSIEDPELVDNDDLQALVESGAATIQEGDETVPDTIKPQWEILSAGLRDLIAGFEAAGYDWAAIPEDSREAIVDGLNNPEPNAERDAAREVMTDWYIGNCLAPAPAPAPEPTPVRPAFTG